MVGLTFDWDDVGLEDKIVQRALDNLTYEFGQGNVWYRISSSGEGLHIIIGSIQVDPKTLNRFIRPTPMESNKQMQYRNRFAQSPWNLECKGRFISDAARAVGGLTTSRIFLVKNDQQASDWKCWIYATPV